MMKHKILDLFSGIGGFSYGFEMANLGETIAFVEKDEFCQKVLRKHWKDVPIIDDIRKVNGKDFGTATIISGGFPCQPFSVAGKRKGKDDDRYLWDETIRVVAECKPKWFIGENVDGIVNISNGTILRQIQEDLEKEGFQVQCLVIPASGIGAWHQRKRVWIIGHNVSNTSCIKYKRVTSKQSGDDTIRRVHFEEKKQTTYDLWGKIARCSRFFTPQSWWQTQSELCGVPDGVSYELHKDRVKRIKGLGNSIVPQIAQLIGESILKAEHDT
jgi:DNA (cytosine-5)-methyltransferase 1